MEFELCKNMYGQYILLTRSKSIDFSVVVLFGLTVIRDFNKVIFEAAWTIAPSHEMLTNLKEVSEKMVTIRKSFKKKLELDTVKQLEHEIEKTNLIADLLDDVKSINITIHAALIPVVMLRGLSDEDFKKYDIDTGTKIGILVVSAIPPKRSDLKPEDILIKPAYGKMQ